MRILVVESDPAVSAGFVRAMQREQFSVDRAMDGERALELATSIDYSAIILSWESAKMNGLTVLKRLRKADSHVRVLMTSERQRVSDRIRALEAGADDFLTKPIALEELTARVQALLRRPAKMLSTLRVDTLELDRIKRRVSRSGTPVTLTRNEYAVLELLVRNAEYALSAETLMQGAWGVRYPELATVVDVYVNRLRAKIDGGDARPLIQSVPGVGYRITRSLLNRRIQ